MIGIGAILFLIGYFGSDIGLGYFIPVILLFLGVILFLAGFFVKRHYN